MRELGFNRVTLCRFLRCTEQRLQRVIDELGYKPALLTKRFTIAQTRAILERFYGRGRQR